MLKAIRNHDPAFGNGLRAYAVPCITGELKRHFRDKRWQVKVTRPLQEPLLEMLGISQMHVSRLQDRALGRLPDGRAGYLPFRETIAAGDDQGGTGML